MENFKMNISKSILDNIVSSLSLLNVAITLCVQECFCSYEVYAKMLMGGVHDVCN